MEWCYMHLNYILYFIFSDEISPILFYDNVG